MRCLNVYKLSIICIATRFTSDHIKRTIYKQHCFRKTRVNSLADVMKAKKKKFWVPFMISFIIRDFLTVSACHPSGGFLTFSLAVFHFLLFRRKVCARLILCESFTHSGKFVRRSMKLYRIKF